MEFVPGPDLPTGGTIVGLDGIKDAYANGRGASRPAAKVTVESLTPRARPAWSSPSCPTCRPREGHREDQGRGARQEAQRHRGRHRPHRPQPRPAPRDRHQDRLQPRRRARAAVPADAARGLVQHQQRRARRRRAADARPAASCCRSTSRTASRSSPAAVAFRLARRRRSACTSSRACWSRSSTSTRSSRSSARATTPSRRARASWSLRPEPGAGGVHPRAAPAATDEVLAHRARGRARQAQAPRSTSSSCCSASRHRIEALVSDELAEVAERYGTPRRTLLTDARPRIAGRGGGAAAAARGGGCPVPRVPRATGRIAARRPCRRPRRRADHQPAARRSKHDAIRSTLDTTSRAEIGAVTSLGRLSGSRPSTCRCCRRPRCSWAPGARRRLPGAAESRREGPRARLARRRDRSIALGTKQGVVKRVVRRRLPEQARVRGHRPQGRRRGRGRRAGRRGRRIRVRHLRRAAAAVPRRVGTSAGLPGRRHGRHQPRSRRPRDPLHERAADAASDAVVVTIAASSETLLGTDPGQRQGQPFAEFPRKGRATGGVRSQRFLKGEDALHLAWVGPLPRARGRHRRVGAAAARWRSQARRVGPAARGGRRRGRVPHRLTRRRPGLTPTRSRCIFGDGRSETASSSSGRPRRTEASVTRTTLQAAITAACWSRATPATTRRARSGTR